MKPNVYIDIDVKPGDKGAASFPHQSSKILTKLHSCFKKEAGRYAIDLPFSRALFTCIRVFGNSMDDMIALGSQLHEMEIENLGRLSFPKKVPENFLGQGVKNSRYRISSRKSRTQKTRFTRIKQAEEQQLPYFMLKSHSTHQAFSLIVKREVIENFDLIDCNPNSYGLNSEKHTCVLPLMID
ncbi:type I-F CRISPR-associated endoribonuclease Cas6/Csy4 [Hydrogenovibrio halophilus]|uniref:type I-F CRISPR-associated endoribonuclease Cas6/Csy4 n=1 Tax=Hydrogenovibrio halophilus TaxID=373391 RepID=UPI00036D2570|nr:type I-F CRISPR-associated endoribonuclease Cas6/Csy4 [Hydrogenovibrio halophilus]